MRGKVPTFHPPSGAVGITPAYAGKRRLCVVAAHLGRDHPRVCGEKKRKGENNGTHLGSPPRMRGKAQGALDGTETDRITPAYAGKSAGMKGALSYTEDHPRVCGEKPARQVFFRAYPGSPPRMRGKDLKRNTKKLRTRITPAYAGKRPCGFCPVRSLRDHPRVCGEKPWLISFQLVDMGSPPRMRGKD